MTQLLWPPAWGLGSCECQNETRRHQNYSIVKNKQQAKSSKRAKRSRKKHLLPGGLFLADRQPELVFATKKEAEEEIESDWKDGGNSEERAESERR